MHHHCGVKICGTTTVEDARLADVHGADYFGVVVEVNFSPRSLTIDQSAPLFAASYAGGIKSVALVFHMEQPRLEVLIETLKPHAVQFLSLADIAHIRKIKQAHPDIQLWQSVHLPAAGNEVDCVDFENTVREYVDAGIDLLIFDTVAVLQGVEKFGGTGLISDWSVVRKLMDKVETTVPIWLAGGIDPDNVAEAVRAVHPAGVDLCSGVEAEPGRKDPEKVAGLLKNSRRV